MPGWRGRMILAAALLAAAGTAAAAPASGLDLPGFDPAVRARDDLFRAANGAWLAATPIPPDKAWFGTVDRLRDLSDQRVRSIAVELLAVPQREGSEAQKLARCYASFMDLRGIERRGVQPLLQALAEVDAIDSREALARWLGEAQGRVGTALVLVVRPDPDDPGVLLARTWQGGLGLPDRDYYLLEDERFAKARTAYADYLQQLGALAGDADAAAHAAEALALEQAIAQLHRPRAELRNPLRNHHPMTVAALAAAAPGFDWPAYLGAAGLGGIERLSVSQPEGATALAQLLGERPLAEWRSYLRLRLIDDMADVLPQGFRDARFAFRGRVLSGAVQDRPRWQRGVAELNAALGEAVGRRYVAKHFPPAARQHMQRLVDELMAAYAESIDTLGWMGEATRAQARDKLARIKVKIGYPERWLDYGKLAMREGDAFGNRWRAGRFDWERSAARAGQPVDRGEWGMTPQTVNAYYSPPLNEIVFPAAILQPPLFDPAADDAVNFGAIGAIIGHEISHGFDDQGSRFDGDGRLRNWWTEADRQAFDALGTRLAEQYSQYTPIPGRHVDGRLTLGENIADLSGLQIAFKAWRRSLRGAPAPVLDGYSGAQRFFFGWAQAWRFKIRDEAALQRLSTDPHSPPPLRANGAALNHDGFHEAFGTEPGDPMFKPAEERIRIW